MATIAQLMNALPEQQEPAPPADELAIPALAEAALRPVPVGRLRRIGLLGTLQAKIAAAYLFYWVRGWFRNADEREKLLAETHWRTAVRVLDSMSYLRGAMMKVGQTLGSFPDIVPKEFVETLEQLHFQAPPMHWSLLREMVFNELGDDPEKIFASFETRAFAAASIGQVHRACLKSGQEVAIKVQYPGIARTIREDFRNLFLFTLPARLSADWENTREQFDDLRMRLERETEYEREAATLQRVRLLFGEDEGIVIPRVFPEHSTGRVLTMERLDGMHLDQFLQTDPPQDLRNEFARKTLRAWYRMLYTGRLLYADFHPGNFIFMEDGRLGVIDFGCMIELDETLWELFRKMDRALTTGRREDRIEALKEWSWIGDDPAEEDRIRLTEQFADWSWQSRYCGGAYDFSDTDDFRRGIDIFVEMVRKRYSRAQPCTPVMARQQMGWRAILYRLRAKVDVAQIAEEEVRATGWDRSGYAPKK
ncbi:MAG TPA: AarF/ABC1/UbiB kinase family protein [Tepidisphaeraceae bacterium]|jgi:predicted unusual protein kinase regulating ubiquinone biosynthesis (AarF/ABC1/UbiB family)|nr:AarF/ABC1/UbiB kinase family protein [Tepidisphaeraceae bacterium]